MWLSLACAADDGKDGVNRQWQQGRLEHMTEHVCTAKHEPFNPPTITLPQGNYSKYPTKLK